eukprot:13952101-Ditylum_brightwellii.AAC.1
MTSSAGIGLSYYHVLWWDYRIMHCRPSYCFLLLYHGALVMLKPRYISEVLEWMRRRSHDPTLPVPHHCGLGLVTMCCRRLLYLWLELLGGLVLWL